ncbi:MAG: LacI family DNA-binding transcriptional regulator [Opitutales bacterium]|nr:LacI family DNA-binding transcriptional regulator [Opitutales bacterium]
MRRVTMQDIAERAGVTKMAVSLALRGQGRLREETRARIRQLAEEMGYVPDPALRALNTHRQQLKTADKGEVIAFVVDWSEREPWKRLLFIRSFKEGLEAGARQLGYRVVPFWAGDAPGKALERILLARGIRSIVLAPEPQLEEDRLPLDIDWSRFSVVRLGRTHRDIPVPSVTHDHFGAMRMVFGELMARGYRRPALIHPERVEARVEHRYSAAFQFLQRELPKENRLPLLLSPAVKVGEASFLSYCRAHRPDVCLSSDSTVLHYLRAGALDIPRDIGFVSLDVQDNQPQVSGILQGLPAVGAAGANLIDLLIRTNMRGTTATDYKIVLGGTWQEGSTLRSA